MPKNTKVTRSKEGSDKLLSGFVAKDTFTEAICWIKFACPFS